MKEKKEFNFARHWKSELIRENQSPKQWKTKALLWGTGFVIWIAIMGCLPWIWEYKVQRDIVHIGNQISSLGEISNQVKQLDTLKAQVRGQQELLALIQNSTQDPTPILEKLKKALPPGTQITTFSLKGNTVIMNISVSTPIDVARLWGGLRNSGLFQEVDLKTISLQDKVQSLNFNLRLK
ncbi:PilN domain-containing protein [Desulfosporosinus sp. FKB]|uniref:PilN domain-containing protein n=1 Tax=Desulfosporosinus sp. FKB TaxID=1969835 RepID=UPI000B499D04|nr:PilN domain-containing protein [Desulfosporosinus sp. FKB]